MSKIRILLADDHAVVRMGLAALLNSQDDLEVVGQAKNGELAVSEAVRLSPDVVIMDLMMPVLDGAGATSRLRKEAPGVKVLVLTSYADSSAIAKAKATGASGALMKTAENTELLAAIRAIAAGGEYLSEEISALLATDPPLTGITGRQSEVLEALALGLTTKKIASRLQISPRSVEDHVNNLLAKLGASNRSEAVAIALRKHLLKS